MMRAPIAVPAVMPSNVSAVVEKSRWPVTSQMKANENSVSPVHQIQAEQISPRFLRLGFTIEMKAKQPGLVSLVENNGLWSHTFQRPVVEEQLDVLLGATRNRHRRGYSAGALRGLVGLRAIDALRLIPQCPQVLHPDDDDLVEPHCVGCLALLCILVLGYLHEVRLVIVVVAGIARRWRGDDALLPKLSKLARIGICCKRLTPTGHKRRANSVP
jgi:hypothetical protein